jgi:hypothetical protein
MYLIAQAIPQSGGHAPIQLNVERGGCESVYKHLCSQFRLETRALSIGIGTHQMIVRNIKDSRINLSDQQCVSLKAEAQSPFIFPPPFFTIHSLLVYSIGICTRKMSHTVCQSQ